jgi:hypothetical protein
MQVKSGVMMRGEIDGEIGEIDGVGKIAWVI